MHLCVFVRVLVVIRNLGKPQVRSLVAGYFSNAARKSSGDVYRVLTRGLLAVGNESKKAPPFAHLQV